MTTIDCCNTQNTYGQVASTQQWHEPEWHESECAFAAQTGNLELLKSLREQGCPWDSQTLVKTNYPGNLACRLYAQDHGCPGTSDTYNFDPECNLLSEVASTMIQLTDNGSSWVRVSQLPTDLMNYGSVNFASLFKLHPEERHSIITRNGGVEPVTRWQHSYLNTPEYDTSDEYFKSNTYMYAANPNQNARHELPELFRPFYEHMKMVDPRYNQVVVNWYDEDDYINFHHDCQRKLVVGVPIVVVTLSQTDLRHFEFNHSISSKNTNAEHPTPLYSKLKINLRHGCVIEMGGNIQLEFSHGVRPIINAGKRISISFRACM
jgi:alkylated DNA repair dioxygenase AlkB